MKRLIVALILALGVASQAEAIPARTGTPVTGTAGVGAASISLASMTVSANDAIVATVFSSSSASRTITSITDAGSLCAVSWITAATHTNLLGHDSLVGSVETIICYKTNAHSGVIQATWDNTVSNGAVAIAQEYSGTNITADPYDSAPVWNLNTGSPGTSLTLSAPAVAHSLVVTSVAVQNATNGVSFSGGPSLDTTKDDATSGTSLAFGDIVDDTAGVTIGATSTHAGTEIIQTAVILKGASAGGTTPSRLMLLGVGGLVF